MKMNKINLIRKRNRIFQLLKFGTKRNCVRYNITNSDFHELTKALICLEIQKEGKEYVSEAEFTKGGRADILILDTGTAIEILASEKIKEVKEKVKKYPEELEVVATTSFKEWKEDNYKVIR